MKSNEKQLNLRLPPHGVPSLIDVPASLVAKCDNYRQAVRLCMSFCQAGYSEQWWAEQLDMNGQGTLNVVLNGGTRKRRRYLNPDLFERIELLAGNRAISQYFDLQSKGMLERQRPYKQQRIEELEQELEQLKLRGMSA